MTNPLFGRYLSGWHNNLLIIHHMCAYLSICLIGSDFHLKYFQKASVVLHHLTFLVHRLLIRKVVQLIQAKISVWLLCLSHFECRQYNKSKSIDSAAMAMFCAAIVVSTAATNNDSGVFKGSNDCPSFDKIVA